MDAGKVNRENDQQEETPLAEPSVPKDQEEVTSQPALSNQQKPHEVPEEGPEKTRDRKTPITPSNNADGQEGERASPRSNAKESAVGSEEPQETPVALVFEMEGRRYAGNCRSLERQPP